MNTGHEGSMTSLHSNSPVECLERMENLFLLSGYDFPYKVVRKQILSAVDFIIQISRDRDGNRVISEVLELTGMEGDTILTNSIASYEEGELKSTGFVPQRIELIEQRSELERGFFS
jgi:pilus assembly protein CpaF